MDAFSQRWTRSPRDGCVLLELDAFSQSWTRSPRDGRVLLEMDAFSQRWMRQFFFLHFVRPSFVKETILSVFFHLVIRIYFLCFLTERSVKSQFSKLDQERLNDFKSEKVTNMNQEVLIQEGYHSIIQTFYNCNLHFEHPYDRKQLGFQYQCNLLQIDVLDHSVIIRLTCWIIL